jgi:hypothetical protein
MSVIGRSKYPVSFCFIVSILEKCCLVKYPLEGDGFRWLAEDGGTII